MMPVNQRQMDFELLEQATPLRQNSTVAFSAPLFGSHVPSGFPNYSAEAEDTMDLNDLCVHRPATTYFVTASGDSMLEAGIHDNDVLVVDRSIRASDGDIVVAALNGDFTVKVLRTKPSLSLEPRNSAHSIIDVSGEDDFDIFGVVTYVVHSTY